ncbi:hypothetical protein F4821DRAFT_222053 [Hypoxylon rubiginosum]|uniref:Uncharacterized protein n=1 Tax=Hypoxylon rubiginosum TaxID=110542 RepID=A0ACC0DJZ8_9PEZI|nr:hypothetical protein F4821DRAFT_222053 [Hypoxylon rubiginosum]
MLCCVAICISSMCKAIPPQMPRENEGFPRDGCALHEFCLLRILGPFDRGDLRSMTCCQVQ